MPARRRLFQGRNLFTPISTSKLLHSTNEKWNRTWVLKRLLSQIPPLQNLSSRSGSQEPSYLMASVIECRRRAPSTLISESCCCRNINDCSLQASPSRPQSWRNLESCQIQSMYAVFTSKANQDLKPIQNRRDTMLVAVTKISSQIAFSNIPRILEPRPSRERRGTDKGTIASLNSCHTVATRVRTSILISRIWRSTLWMRPTELHLQTKPA